MRFHGYLLPAAIALFFLCWMMVQRKELMVLAKENASQAGARMMDEGGERMGAGGRPVVKRDRESREPETKRTAFADLAKKYYKADILMDGSSAKIGAEMMRLAESSSPEQIAGYIDELETMGMSNGLRYGLIRRLVSILAEHAPEQVFARFGAYEDSRSVFDGELVSAFDTWMKTHPKAAKEWFDRELKKGSFDSRSIGRGHFDTARQHRIIFERRVVEEMMASDAPAALSRMDALPDDLKAEVMKRFSTAPATLEERREYLEIARRLPGKDRDQGAAVAFLNFVRGEDGWTDKLTRLFGRFAATEDEKREAVVLGVSDRFASPELSPGEAVELVRWAEALGADEVQKKLLEVLLMKRGDYRSTLEVAKACARETGDDTILAGILRRRTSPDHREAAWEATNDLRDERLREEIRSRLK